MNEFKEINPIQLRRNTFQIIGKEWMLLAAGNTEKVNAMTASWGGLGVMYGKDVAYIVVRPHRYTREFIDREESFSINFFGKEYRKMLNYMGTVSGRNEDKLAHAGLKPVFNENAPCFNEANLIMICKKLFRQPLSSDSLLDDKMKQNWYPNGDHHILYIAEIVKVYKK